MIILRLVLMTLILKKSSFIIYTKILFSPPPFHPSPPFCRHPLSPLLSMSPPLSLSLTTTNFFFSLSITTRFLFFFLLHHNHHFFLYYLHFLILHHHHFLFFSFSSSTAIVATFSSITAVTQPWLWPLLLLPIPSLSS